MFLLCLMKYLLHITKQTTDLCWIEMNLMSFQHITLVEMRKRTPKIAPFLALIVLLTIPLYYPSIIDSSKKLNTTFESSIDSLKDTNNPCSSLDLRCKENEPDATAQHHDAAAGKETREEAQPAETEPATPTDEKCDLFSGEWVPNPEGPYYTNATCYAIQEHQNCMRSGRPDVGYLKWRWKPDECELPIFDPLQFLELVRGKSLAFVGDSVARNHMQSLICLLASKAGYPVDASTDRIQNKRYQYPAYDFNISMFWSPFLVRTAETNLEKPPFTVHLDQFHQNWTAQIASFDYVIISAGHWFTRPSYLYLNNSLIGCIYCAEPNITHLLPPFGCRWAFRTAFRAINSAAGFDGVAFVRTFAPSHFEGGAWDDGGKCARTSPFKRNEAVVGGSDLEMYLAQVEELGIAQKAERKNGGKLKVLDVTKIMLMRPDGHPNKYSHLAGTVQSLANDCVHWCLPGPIDSWNDILQELLRIETGHKIT
ncbi:protein trichome birefringence-like 19 [Primulina eburnea]|uniref:protein trichome birefringence-like 19 n=1 Tax=Primulina eburnea TaxID=1245227 RepID=UPI003C6CAA0D